MHATKRKKYISLGVILMIIIFIFVLCRAVLYEPADEIIPPAELQKTIDKNTVLSQYPVRLSIPSVGISAIITSVGITKSGAMATPRNFADVGWYKYGPMPGEQGSAVIAGHVDNGLGLPAVFARLKDMKIGDDIYVQTQSNGKVHFVVTALETYDFNASASSVFAHNDEKLLKLITCSGVWLPEFKTHDKRLVITAIKI